MSGNTVEEVAAAEKISVIGFWKLRERWGFSLGKKTGDTRRRVSALVGGELSDALDELAVDMKTDPAGALAEILKWALADDARPARRELRVPRRAIKSLAEIEAEAAA